MRSDVGQEISGFRGPRVPSRHTCPSPLRPVVTAPRRRAHPARRVTLHGRTPHAHRSPSPFLRLALGAARPAGLGPWAVTHANRRSRTRSAPRPAGHLRLRPHPKRWPSPRFHRPHGSPSPGCRIADPSRLQPFQGDFCPVATHICVSSPSSHGLIVLVVP